MLHFTPILSRLRAKLAPSAPFLERAAEVVELEPGWTREAPPAISLPNELERVKSFYGEAAVQVTRLTESIREERPKLIYRYDDALVADCTVYAGGTYRVYRSGGKRPIIAGKPSEIEEAQLCTTPVAENYFGHFLREALPMELLARERGLPALSFARTPWFHEPGYRELIGLAPLATRYARVRKLWLVDETTLNGGWARRFGEIRRHIREQIRPTGDLHVFLLRGSNRITRNLVNEHDLAEKLESHGFRVIDPEGMEPSSICAALAAAKVVACVEGSVQNHAFLAMPRGAALLSIQPPHRFNSLPKLVADAVGVRFAYVVAEPRDGGFYLDPDRFMETLELLSGLPIEHAASDPGRPRAGLHPLEDQLPPVRGAL
jgi:hypothetical protein